MIRPYSVLIARGRENIEERSLPHRRKKWRENTKNGSGGIPKYIHKTSAFKQFKQTQHQEEVQ